MGTLEGKIALVTGSTHGIGRATALLFAKEGAAVVVNGRDAEAGDEVVRAIREAGGKAAFFQADVGDSAALHALIRFTTDTYDGLHILINNAYSGGMGGWGSLAEISEEDWDHAMTAGFRSVFLGSKLAIPEIVRSGGGAIVNISSIHGFVTGFRSAAYNTIKAGIINLTRHMAMVYGKQGIRVNAICPGYIATEREKRWALRNPVKSETTPIIYPLGRAGEPEEVAQCALFLSSDMSSFVTGHTLVVDGGLTVQNHEEIIRPLEAHFRTKFAQEWGVGIQDEEPPS